MDPCSGLAFILIGAGVIKLVWTVYLATKHPDTFREMEARKHEMKKTGLGLALKMGSRWLK